MRRAPARPAGAASAVGWAARRLAESGIGSPRRQAEALVRAALGIGRERLLAHPETPVDGEALARLEALVARRAAREPLAYVVGEVEFYSLSFRLTPCAIVPRPETEVLVEAAAERARARGARSAADVGTGCGAVAVALAREVPGLRVAATDISVEALSLARENAARHGVADRVHAICTDLLAGVRGRFDCIAANLPYVRQDEFPGLSAEIRDYEPRLGLDGGPDGLAVIRRLIGGLYDHLSAGGLAALEVGAGQADEVAKLLRAGQLSPVEVNEDYAGIARVVIGWRQG